MRRYASDDPEPAPIPDLDKPAYWERPFRRPATGEGMHRFVWDLREPPPQSVAQDLPISAVPHDTPRVPEGALVVPGRYTVALDADGLSLRQSLTVVMDPRVSMSAAQLRQQYALARVLTSLMDRSFRDAAAAKSAGRESRRASSSSRSTKAPDNCSIRSTAPTHRRPRRPPRRWAR